MDVLKDVAVELPCNQCGRHYEVTLGQILLSQSALRHDCIARGETECEPLFDAALLSHDLIEEFVEVWTRLETAARSSGGELRSRSTGRGVTRRSTAVGARAACGTTTIRASMSTETRPNSNDTGDPKPEVAPSGTGYRGIITRDGGVTWSCLHVHFTDHSAHKCAERHLDSRDCAVARQGSDAGEPNVRPLLGGDRVERNR